MSGSILLLTLYTFMVGQGKILPLFIYLLFVVSMIATRCATSRKVPGSIPGGVTGDFFPWYPRQNHVP